MKIFQTIQRHYATLGFRPANQTNGKYSFDLRVIFGFLPLGCICVSKTVFILYVSSDFVEYMESICTLLASLQTFVFYVAIISKRTKLFENIEIESMEKFIDARSKYLQSKAFFVKTNQEIERTSEVTFTVSLKFAVPLLLLPKCIASFGTYFTTDLGRDSFQLSMPMWFPFDWKNPFGYLIAFIIQYTTVGYEFFITACSLAVGIGSFWFGVSATQDIERILHSIDHKAQSNAIQLNEFIKFIEAHGTIKQVERVFSGILQPLAMSLFTWSLVVISCALLSVQVEILHHGNVLPVLVTIVSGINGLVTLLVICEFGQRMSDAFEAIEYTIDQFDWYLFPIEFKRMLPMIIANAQPPVELECFGSITCSREVFRKILRCAYSYFTVLCQLDD